MPDPRGERRQSVSAMAARPGVMNQPPTWPPPLCIVCGKDAATHLGFTRIVTCGQFQPATSAPLETVESGCEPDA